MTPEELLSLNPGDSVVMNQKGLDQGLIGHATVRDGTVYGTVVSTQPLKGWIVVSREGLSLNGTRYSRNFWDIA